MSARRSWDARSNAAPAAPPRDPKGKRSLKERRRKAQRIFFVALAVILLLALGGALYAVWQQPVRIHEVTAEGPHAEEVRGLAQEKLYGSYAYLIPRNSIFFFPEREIRKAVLDAQPSVAAVSVARTGFESIAVKAIERVSAFMWCGSSSDMPSPDGLCYSVDAEGMVFEPVASDAMASSSALRIYAPLDVDLAVASPLRAHVVGAENIPNALRLVKTIRGMNIPISAVSLRGDEADLWVNDVTRITYVLGKEEEAAALAAASFPTLHLTDRSLQYVDLRFAKKVYLKRYGE